MRKIMRPAGAIALAAVAAMSVSAATAAAPTSAASSWAGCSSGTVCLYADISWDGGPTDHWVTYGSHNLRNVYGLHRLFNNQTDGAGAYICTGYNGGGSCLRVNAGTLIDDDFTTINSVVLTRH
jgi:hypothetical protein